MGQTKAQEKTRSAKPISFSDHRKSKYAGNFFKNDRRDKRKIKNLMRCNGMTEFEAKVFWNKQKGK